jgi:hypothetical protein
MSLHDLHLRLRIRCSKWSGDLWLWSRFFYLKKENDTDHPGDSIVRSAASLACFEVWNMTHSYMWDPLWPLSSSHHSYVWGPLWPLSSSRRFFFTQSPCFLLFLSHAAMKHSSLPLAQLPCTGRLLLPKRYVRRRPCCSCSPCAAALPLTAAIAWEPPRRLSRPCVIVVVGVPPRRRGVIELVRHPVGNPKRKVWWVQQQVFPQYETEVYRTNRRKNQLPKVDARWLGDSSRQYIYGVLSGA